MKIRGKYNNYIHTILYPMIIFETNYKALRFSSRSLYNYVTVLEMFSQILIYISG